MHFQHKFYSSVYHSVKYRNHINHIGFLWSGTGIPKILNATISFWGSVLDISNFLGHYKLEKKVFLTIELKKFHNCFNIGQAINVLYGLLIFKNFLKILVSKPYLVTPKVRLGSAVPLTATQTLLSV